LREVQSHRAAPARVEKQEARALIEEKAEKPLERTNAGLVERLLARLLTPHERLVAEMLLIERPQSSGIFYTLLVYTVLFLVANSFIRFQSADEMLRAAILNFDRTAIAAIVGCLACFVLFSVTFLRGLSLFGWHASPEWLAIRSKDTALNPFFTFRLFPVSHWDVVKVISKVNSALFLILLPVAVIVSQSPIFQLLGAHRNTLALLPKCLVLLWAATVLVASLKLNPCTDGLRYWRALIAVIIMGSVFSGFAGAFMMSPNLVADIVLIILLVMLTLAWVTYWGFRYCRGLR